MIHLEIGRKTTKSYGYGYGLDNTTKAMNFTRVKRSSKIMQILKFIITHPRQFNSREILKRVYKQRFNPACSWLGGFFSALHHFGLATFTRHGHACKWEATPLGISFYKQLSA